MVRFGFGGILWWGFGGGGIAKYLLDKTLPRKPTKSHCPALPKKEGEKRGEGALPALLARSRDVGGAGGCGGRGGGWYRRGRVRGGGLRGCGGAWGVGAGGGGGRAHRHCRHRLPLPGRRHGHRSHSWRLLDHGIDAVTEVPKERWDIDAWHDSDPDAPGKIATRWGGFLSGLEKFDAAFFGVSPREAISTDPQLRLLFETTWESAGPREESAPPPDRLMGSDTGVFAMGLINNEYQTRTMRDLATVDPYDLLRRLSRVDGGSDCPTGWASRAPTCL